MENWFLKIFKKHWMSGLYISSLVFCIFYYLLCYSHIFNDLYILRSVDIFFNVLVIILIVIVPVFWFAGDLWKLKINVLFKLVIIMMSFLMLSFAVLFVLFIVFLNNPMTLKDDKVTYNLESDLYVACSCRHDDCINTEYVAKFIFLKKVS